MRANYGWLSEKKEREEDIARGERVVVDFFSYM
jgi:hypothetical protein